MKNNFDDKVDRKFMEGAVDSTTRGEIAYSSGLKPRSSHGRSVVAVPSSQKPDDKTAFSYDLTRKSSRRIKEENSQKPVQIRF